LKIFEENNVSHFLFFLFFLKINLFTWTKLGVDNSHFLLNIFILKFTFFY